MRESGKTYLETIYTLQQANGTVHSVDVAQALNFSKPSVSRAMGLLKEAGLIEMAKNGAITITKTGAKQIKEITEKRDTIAYFLMATTGIDQAVAEKDAAALEDCLSKDAYQGMKAFLKEIEA